MKWHKVIKMIVLILVFILIYELGGVLAGYHRQPEVSEQTKKETDIGRFLEPAENPERAAVVEKNGDALRERVRLIHNAKEELILSTFAFHSDESGKIMIGALLDAAERGVKIRILADGFEALTAMEGNPYFYALSSMENIEIKIYNKVNPLKPWELMGRMHDKYLIADGCVYLLGGRNTFNYFLGDFPGHKNFDRDVLVVCEKPQEENSVRQLIGYFENIWQQKTCRYFHEKASLQKRDSVREAAQDAKKCYETYAKENAAEICDTDYAKGTFETEKIALIANPVYPQAKEPTAWYEMAELMKNAKQRVKIHTPYIICNEMMYDAWEEISGNVSDFSVMTNSVANNGNPFGAADYDKNRDRILSTGIDVWEYEGGYSYHGKSILIDDDISIVGSFNMDMRSVYLDTELMLVVRSKELNEQLEANMMEYERTSRQILPDGTYHDPYGVTPVALTKKRERRIILVEKFLGWARFLF